MSRLQYKVPAGAWSTILHLITNILYPPSAIMLLMDLPYNVIDTVVSAVAPTDLNSLAAVNQMLRYKVSRILYSKIMVTDGPMEVSGYTVVPVSQLEHFCHCLNPYTFRFINRIVIHSQSNIHSHDYQVLYETLSKLWDSNSHRLKLFNFDIHNLRTLQSFNHYLHSRSIQYIENEDEDNCELTQRNFKVNNLQNWIVFDINELSYLPFNPNLEELDVCFESSLLTVTTKPLHQMVTRALLANLANLKSLYLNTPTSFSVFNSLVQCSPIHLSQLRKLSLTSSHCFRHNQLNFNEIINYIDLNKLHDLEIKMNCTLGHCTDQCVPKFFADWFHYNQVHNKSINLNKLVIINYKANNSDSNLAQFNQLIQNFVVSHQFDSVENLVINVDDFTKLNLARTANVNAPNSLQMFLKNLPNLTNLKNVTIPDFFYRWLKEVPGLLQSQTFNHFDILVNQCKCHECNTTRSLFKHLAKNGYQNNLKFQLSDASSEVPVSDQNINTDDKANLQFLHFVISKLKHEFVYLNQNLFSVNSHLNSNDKPFVYNDELVPFNKLFLHSSLYEVTNYMKTAAPLLASINLGGILIEYDHDSIKSPY